MWPKFRNPWFVVGGAIAGLMVSNGPVLTFTFGIFLKPLTEDMGWSRAQAAFALSIGGVSASLLVPILGRMMDRWGIRRVALPGLVIFGGSLAAVGLSPHSFVIFTLLFTLAETAGAIQTPVAYAKAISAWFDRRRGAALGIAMSGIGLGGFLMPQFAQFLIMHLGWRAAYAGLGAVSLAVSFPAVALFIREPEAGEGEVRASRRAVALPGLTPREALSGTLFWRLGVAIFLAAIALAGTVGHVVPLLTDRGLSPSVAAATLGVFGLSTMCGRFFGGFLVDRIFAPYVAAVFFLAPIVGFVLLATATGPFPALGVALMGLGQGTEIDLIAFLVSRYFGQKSFGQLYGWLFMMFLLGATLGRFLGGVVYDLARSYTPFLLGNAAALMIAVALIIRLGPYAYPVERDPAAEPLGEAVVN
jgi:predicted MFS family arabinose efflux permease